MPRLHSLASYALTCGLAAASLALAVVVDSRMDAAAPQRGGGAVAAQLVGGAGLPRDGAADAARNWRDPAAAPPQLAGVLVSEGAQRLALVSVNGLRALVRPGDVLDGGYKVVAIDGDSLTYQVADGRTQRVAVHDAPVPGDAAPSMPTVALPAVAAPVADAAAPASGNEAFRQAVEQRLASMRH